MFIIGSTALKELYPDFKREPKDLDIIYKGENKPELSIQVNNKNLKIELLRNDVLYDYVKSNLSDGKLTGDVLLTLKCSHIFWDINWDKHMFDICFLLEKGNKIILSLFHDLYKQWDELHGKNYRSDLKMTKEDFFNNALNCPYDHDTLHTYIKFIPTYTKILKEGAEVEVCEEKFKLLPHEDKISLVQEEVYIMAFERYSKLNYKAAYYKMLKKFIISHAPIWEAIFILENFRELDRPKFNFISHLNKTLKNKQ